MKNFDYGKKYHYMIKYAIMFLPFLVLVLGHFWVSDIVITNSITSYVEALFTYLRGLSINNWYSIMLRYLGFNSYNGLSFVLESYPLYIIWLYLFDIIVDLFGLVPRLAHKLITKIGGDY